MIRDFPSLTDEFLEAYDEIDTIEDGSVSSVLPLIQYHPSSCFGVSICTVDGQVSYMRCHLVKGWQTKLFQLSFFCSVYACVAQTLNIGDTKIEFPISQGIIPFLHALALRDQGAETVSSHDCFRSSMFPSTDGTA